MAGGANRQLDVIVVGAGFAGLYMLHKLRGLGFSAIVIEAAPDVGGTWYWNRYPGARCDVESVEYCYSFDDGIQQDWTWTERFAAQPEIQRYLSYVADRLGLRRDISFSTRVTAAVYDEDGDRWTVTTGGGESISAQYCVMATGCLSAIAPPNIPGLDAFKGDIYHSAAWPAEGVDLAGKSVGIIGTGSTGVQMIPLLAEQAGHLSVFQRTPAFSVPARNKPLDADYVGWYKAHYPERRQIARASPGGFMLPVAQVGALDVSEAERQSEYERRWAVGGGSFLFAYSDLLIEHTANATAAHFLRGKIQSIVEDGGTAAALTPQGFPVGAKRICLDTNYFATFNRPNVTLVDLQKNPIEHATATGMQCGNTHVALDILVLATGYDAITGALSLIDIVGRGGRTLKDKWRGSPCIYLGLMAEGFPNMFVVNGPGSPSVFGNVVMAIEQHVEWISDCIGFLDARKATSIEPRADLEEKWAEHVDAVAWQTLFPQAPSWYLGANIEGKAAKFLSYVGGQPAYRQICDDIARADYEPFVIR